MGVSEVTKYLLFFSMNIVIAFCGAILLAFGAILQKDERKGVKNFKYLSVGGFSIGIGVLGLVASAWGLWCLFKRKHSALIYYAAGLLMLFIVQIILGAVALGSLHGSNCKLGDDDLETAIRKLFTQDDNKSLKAIYHIQKNFKCCGVESPAFWQHQMKKPFPISCCEDQHDPCEQPFEKGCAPVYSAAIERNVGIIGGIAIGFCPVLLVTAILAWYLRFTIKKMQYV